MSISVKLTPAAAIERLAPMTGEYVWGVRTGADAVLRMDFGEPHLVIRHPKPREDDANASDVLKWILRSRGVTPAGHWHLFVFEGFWTVRVDGDVCDRSMVETQNSARALSALNGQKLTGITWDAVSREWRFSFDLGATLSITHEIDNRPIDPRNDSDWVVFIENGGSLVCIRDDWMELEPPGEDG